MALAAPEFQLLLAQLTADLDVKVGRLLRSMDRLDKREALAFITEAYPQLALPYIAAGGALSVQYYNEQPTTSDYLARSVDLIPTDRLATSGRWAILQSQPETALAGSAQRAVMDQSRTTMLENLAAEYDVAMTELAVPGTRWARHASANACGFCRMLATRGAVYRSETDAIKVSGRSISLTTADQRRLKQGNGFATSAQTNKAAVDEALARRSRYSSARAAARQGKVAGDLKTRQPRGIRALGTKYHDSCHCTAIPVRPGGSYEPPDYVEQWDQDYIEATRTAATQGDYDALDPRAVSRQMEAIDRDRRAAAATPPPATAGGSGTPPGPPKPPPSSASGAHEDGDEGWSGHARGYQHPHRQPVWPERERVQRQHTLGIVPDGEQLYQHEIETVERLQQIGETLEWIRKDAKTFRPTNDVKWVSNGAIEVDLKATGSKYSLISQLVRKAVEGGRAQNVVKGHFIVDIGPATLTRKLRTQLGKYNQRNPLNKVTGLWVLTRGQLVEIPLE